jgi:hypothetical protein
MTTGNKMERIILLETARARATTSKKTTTNIKDRRICVSRCFSLLDSVDNNYPHHLTFINGFMWTTYVQILFILYKMLGFNGNLCKVCNRYGQLFLIVDRTGVFRSNRGQQNIARNLLQSKKVINICSYRPDMLYGYTKIHTIFNQ